ncbi:unnamed protein product [Closterium sp. Yama58-4]|nr:unnamed protein product [Closterium sp. Yama58-4]
MAALTKAQHQPAQYEATKAAEIAFKAKVKVEGHIEMGISPLLAGLGSRIKASLISSITLPSGASTDHLPAITAACTSFFSSLYSGSQPILQDTQFWQHIPKSFLPPDLVQRMDAPFTLAEINRAISNLLKGKTPGPDGLPSELYRTHKAHFCLLFLSLLTSSPSPLPALPPSMLRGRTVLIPKKGDSSLLDNLCPVTLMNSDYQVIALCLAYRLQQALPFIIHPSQTAFIKRRKIGDTINDILDIMDWASVKSRPLIALTVDIRKAYDSIDREFLFSSLAHLGIPTSFIAWVRRLHTNTSTCVSVNNLAGADFPVRTGVRQGCPLAPLLFICAIEIFQRHMSLSLPGFALCPAQRRLMACCADDVTLFLNSDVELGVATDNLQTFAFVSGEHSNWAKCSLLLFNIPAQSVSHAGNIPIRSSAEAECILGVFVEQDSPGRTTWDTTLSKIQRTSKVLAGLRATTSCRKSLSNIFLNTVISFPARFQPFPAPILTRLDVAVGNFLSSSRFKEYGLAVSLIPNRIL